MIVPNANFNARLDDAGIDPIILVEIGGDTDWYFATRALHADAGAGYDNYDPIIQSITPIDHRLPEGTFGISIPGDVDVSILNTNPIKSDSIATDLTYAEGKAVLIKYGFYYRTDGATEFLLSEFVTIFTGVVEDFEWNEEALTFHCVDETYIQARTLPLARIAQSGVLVPVDNVGKGYPITYGAHDQALGYVTDTRSQNQEAWFDKTSGVILYAVNGLAIYADRQMVRLRSEAWGGITEWAAKTNNLGIDWSNNGSSKAADGNFIVAYIATPISYYAGAPSNGDDEPNSVDSDFTTFGHINSTATTVLASIAFKIPAIGIDGALLAAYCLLDAHISAGLGGNAEVCWSKMADYSGDVGFIMSGVQVFDAAATDVDNMDDMADAETDFVDPGAAPGEAQTLASDYSEQWSVFGKLRSDGTAPQWDLYEHQVRLDFEYPMKDHIVVYGDVEGREFGASWTDRTSTDLVAHPADVIAAILRQELGLADANFHLDAWTAVVTLLSGWTFAGQVIDDIDSRDLIDTLCKQCLCRQFKRSDGLEMLVGYNSARTSDYDFDDSEMYGFSLGRTDADDLYNEFTVNYHYNPASKKYESQKYLTTDGNNFDSDSVAYHDLVEASQANYGVIRKLEVDADWIRDDATAEAYCKLLADYHTNRYYVATFKTMPKHGFKLELVDIITMDYAWLPAAVNGTSKKWEIIAIKKGLAEIEITAQSFDA